MLIYDLHSFTLLRTRFTEVSDPSVLLVNILHMSETLEFFSLQVFFSGILKALIDCC